MSVKFISPYAKKYHDLLANNDYLLIVACDLLPQSLMTRDGFQALKSYMDEADRQSVQVLEILPESAARLGFLSVWTAEDVDAVFGASKPPSRGS